MIGDEFPGMSVAPLRLRIHSSSLFVIRGCGHHLQSRLKAGARSDMAPSNMFWESLRQVHDPFRHQWGVATHVEGRRYHRDAAPLEDGPARPPGPQKRPGFFQCQLVIRKLQIHFARPAPTAGCLVSGKPYSCSVLLASLSTALVPLLMRSDPKVQLDRCLPLSFCSLRSTSRRVSATPH